MSISIAFDPSVVRPAHPAVSTAPLRVVIDAQPASGPHAAQRTFLRNPVAVTSVALLTVMLTLAAPWL